ELQQLALLRHHERSAEVRFRGQSGPHLLTLSSSPFDSERTVANYCSALMWAARITLPHFSVSVAMSLPKSAGEPRSTVPPRSINRDLILGSSKVELMLLLSILKISSEVPFGAPTPYHDVVS